MTLVELHQELERARQEHLAHDAPDVDGYLAEVFTLANEQGDRHLVCRVALNKLLPMLTPEAIFALVMVGSEIAADGGEL